MDLGQGTGSAPPTFAILSIIIINTYKNIGHGAVTAIIYINKTDLLHLSPEPISTHEEVIKMVQVHQTD